MRDYFKRSDCVTFEEAQKRTLESHNGTIILLEFSGTRNKALFKCSICGTEWKTFGYSVWGKTGCPKCGIEKNIEPLRLSYDYVKDFIESKGCKLLSDKYKSTKENILVLFECGHSSYMCFDSFKRGSRCLICGREKNRLSQRLSDEDLLNRLKEKNLKLIEFPDGYKNRNSKITTECPRGHIETRSLASLLANNGCNQCYLIQASINQSGSKGSNWQGGLSSLDSFLSKQIKQWKKDSIKNSNYCCVICGEGHRFRDVHHLYNFFSIVNDVLKYLGLDKRASVFDYTEEELFVISDLVLKLHYQYPLGVALCRNHHKLFHKYYGLYNNTPEQFDEFKERIKSGEITLPE